VGPESRAVPWADSPTLNDLTAVAIADDEPPVSAMRDLIDGAGDSWRAGSAGRGGTGSDSSPVRSAARNAIVPSDPQNVVTGQRVALSLRCCQRRGAS
jgi:hypothetical protein